MKHLLEHSSHLDLLGQRHECDFVATLLEISQSSLADVMVGYAQPVDAEGNNQLFIPIPGEFTNSGLEFEYYDGFLTNATYVNILPYWHYAE